MAKRTKPPELKVVFDTNVLYTGSASDLLRQEVAEFIEENSRHADLLVTWYLPEIVKLERQYQMESRAIDLLPAVQKLERLLGHNLNITEDVVKKRVHDAIETKVHGLNLQVIPLDSGTMDWNQMIRAAAFRLPPFERGEHEKGFRDALAFETFLQLVSASPSTPKVCRVALVTADSLMIEAVQARTMGLSNVRILPSLEELKSLVNTLISEVSEEFIAKIAPVAKAYFFEKDRQDTLYYVEKIRDRIREQFASALDEIPKGADRRENGTWYVSAPRFVKKDKQRVFWTTRINVEAKAYKRSVPGFAGLLAALAMNLGEQKQERAALAGPEANIPPHLPHFGVPPPRLFPFVPEGTESLLATGTTTFDVTWSAIVTTRLNFRSPRVKNIQYVGTTWESR